MIELALAIVIVLLLVILVSLLLLNQRMENLARESKQMDSQLSQENRLMESRVAKLEARVDNLPTHRDLTELRSGIGAVVESVATIEGQSETMMKMLQTIQKHLLESE